MGFNRVGLGVGERRGIQNPRTGKGRFRRVLNALCYASPQAQHIFSPHSPILLSCCHSPIRRNWKGKHNVN